MVKDKKIPKPGKPRLYAVTAENIGAYQAKANDLGKRFDVYLGEEANTTVSVLMQQHKLSASRVLDTLVRGAANLPIRELNRWFTET